MPSACRELDRMDRQKKKKKKGGLYPKRREMGLFGFYYDDVLFGLLSAYYMPVTVLCALVTCSFQTKKSSGESP